VRDLFSEPLAAHHNRVAFRCGVPELDSYLQTQANQDIRRKVAAVYVLVDRAAPTAIVGYYTLSSFAVETSDLTEEVQKKLPRDPLTPATLVGRLARDLRFPGIGGHLLVDALKRVLRHAGQIASAAVVVDVKNDGALKFYLKHGFLAFQRNPARLFLPITTIQKIS
jgi:ribosomal protein S18 acetylase RimI-like enzyme